MKTIKKLFGIKTTYAIPSDKGVDITKGKKYKFKRIYDDCGSIKDDRKVRLILFLRDCKHIKGGSWKIITE